MSGSPESPIADAIGRQLIDNATFSGSRPEPIAPAVVQDDEAQNYLFSACRQPKVFKLASPLTRLATKTQVVLFLDEVLKAC